MKTSSRSLIEARDAQLAKMMEQQMTPLQKTMAEAREAEMAG